MFKKFFILIVVFVIAAIVFHFKDYMNKKEITTQVIDKERVQKDDDSYYLIFTEAGTYRVEDQIWIGKFNSSDLYGKIKRGKCYTFKVGGFRVGLFSMYPNVMSYEAADCE